MHGPALAHRRVVQLDGQWNDLVGRVCHHGPRRYRLQHPDGIERAGESVLGCALALQPGRDVAREHEHRHLLFESSGDPGDEVGDAGARRPEAEPHLAAGRRERLPHGHVGGAPLVLGDDHAQSAAERGEDAGNATAGNAVRRPISEREQRLHQRVGLSLLRAHDAARKTGEVPEESAGRQSRFRAPWPRRGEEYGQ